MSPARLNGFAFGLTTSQLRAANRYVKQYGVKFVRSKVTTKGMVEAVKYFSKLSNRMDAGDHK
jgi:hypothetical protein